MLSTLFLGKSIRRLIIYRELLTDLTAIAIRKNFDFYEDQFYRCVILIHMFRSDTFERRVNTTCLLSSEM